MRIWIFGKVYDMENNPIADIEKDIEKRLKDFTKVDIGVKLDVSKGNMIEVVFHRGLNEIVHIDTILEQDSWLISGEGYKNFVPAYGIGSFSHFPNILNYIDRKQFCVDYKKNALYYGADKVKSVRIYELPNKLILDLGY